MRYADDVCTYHEEINPHVYVFNGPCVVCKKTIVVKVLGAELFAYRQGEHIQNAMLSVSAGDREFLLTGICSECFDKIFGDLNEESDVEEQDEVLLERGDEFLSLFDEEE